MAKTETGNVVEIVPQTDANGNVYQNDETDEAKRTRNSNYHSPLPVITLSFHKSIETAPDVASWLAQWADQSGLVMETREGGRSGESNRVLFKFDTPETYAIRTASGASSVSRQLLNDVKAKALAQGITPEELLRRALENL